MGYSARYHAASLAAVFLALAIGILVGAEFGGEVLSDTRKSLERSLVSNLEDSRAEVEDLSGRLDRSEEFGQRVYPTLVSDRLFGDRIGLIGLGGLDARLVSDVEAALEPTGGELTGIGVLRRPPATGALAGALEGTRFGGIERDPEMFEDLGRALGRQLGAGGGMLEKLRGEFFTRASGSFGDLDQVLIAYRDPDPDALDPDELKATESLERGLLRGLAGSGVATVGAETTDTEPSTIEFFKSHNLASVDNADTVAGRLAMVLALNGAQGSFGVKDSADSLLPDLITSSGALTLPAATTESPAASSPKGGSEDAGTAEKR